MNQPDILLFISDQHTPYYSGYFGGNVDTPTMDAMAKNGTNAAACYTPCPLCVPSRMAMLSTLMPHKTGIYTNGDTLPDTTPTFLHPLVAAGYETVLIGRMHFIGADQRHGFTKRIAPDMTETTWFSDQAEAIQQRGRLFATFSDFAATKVVGAGESPVIHYDRMVVDQALEYLSQEHEKPQCIVVGTYGPHFPYIGETKLFQKYYDRVALPATLQEIPEYMNELLLCRRRPVTEEVARGCLAAYCAQIELQDQLLGEVRDAFRNFTERRQSRSFFAYLSDHGDQAGDRMIYGKNTFFERSVRVPLLVEGDGIGKGNTITQSVSLLDIGPTLWELTGAAGLEETDGISLMPGLTGKEMPSDRIVFSELLERRSPRPGEPYHYARMALQNGKKYITYQNFEEKDMLFCIDKDPEEQNNIIAEDSAADVLRRACGTLGDPEQILARQKHRDRNKKLFAAWEKAAGAQASETWKDNPPTAKGQLEIEITPPWDGSFPGRVTGGAGAERKLL